MRINIGQTTNLFHVNALNQSVQRNTSEKEEQKSPIRTDIASISPMGKAAVRLQNLVNQIERKDWIIFYIRLKTAPTP